jgi:hypothetical protein
MLLISSPAKAWEEILVEEDKQNNVQIGFVYPSIGLCGLAVFLGSISLEYAQMQLQGAMTKTCSAVIALFGGFFLASFLVEIFSRHYLKREVSRVEVQQLVGYSMGILFILIFFSGLFRGFFILRWILQFYTLWVVWEGANRLMKVAEERRLAYTIVVTLILLLSPWILECLFTQLSQVTQLTPDMQVNP